MKSSRAMFVLLTGVFIARSAWANDPPAPAAWFAEFTIVPLALLIFSWSGAAKLYDEARGAPGGRGRVLLIGILVAFLSGMHEGYAMLTAPLLGAYAVVVGVRMIAASKIAPPRSYARIASRCGGIALIPIALFLASFSWALLGSNRYSHDWLFTDSLTKFQTYQRVYAAEHGGRFQQLSTNSANLDGDKEFEKHWYDSGMYVLSEYTDSRITQIDVKYGSDMKSYQVKVTPLAFVPWPYRLFSPRHAYFMTEDGVIHVERAWTSNTVATPSSPRL